MDLQLVALQEVRCRVGSLLLVELQLARQIGDGLLGGVCRSLRGGGHPGGVEACVIYRHAVW